MFFAEKEEKSRFLSDFICIFASSKPKPAGWRGTTTLRNKRHCTLVFGDLNYHNQIPSKDNGRGDAYGCIYVCSRGVPRVLVPSVHTFGCTIY